MKIYVVRLRVHTALRRGIFILSSSSVVRNGLCRTAHKQRSEFVRFHAYIFDAIDLCAIFLLRRRLATISNPVSAESSTEIKSA